MYIANWAKDKINFGKILCLLKVLKEEFYIGIW